MDRGSEENETGRAILNLSKKALHSAEPFLIPLTNLSPQPKITHMKFRPDDPMVLITMAMRSMEMSSRVWMAR